MGLAVKTVKDLHRMLRRAFRDAVAGATQAESRRARGRAAQPRRSRSPTSAVDPPTSSAHGSTSLSMIASRPLLPAFAVASSPAHAEAS